ncbi:DUF7674 family protein [Frondihabitans australicus]|uniref:DUF7674 domain-containing protein n=1 Tax=Frondihabitans australicus TaxID=386892 RepID=A0A495IN60_9MICO|nr:hypothetical protein [Frondihabitans australicus]RKR76555.1 hypothetical protein C8E83_3732 [Frondihabitans australicus]
MTDEARRVPGDFESWFEGLVRAFPEFSETNDDDFFRDDDGLVLGHLFVGEITANLVAGRLGDRHRVRALLDFLEAGYATGDAYRQNVIALSFVENLGPRSRHLRHLGPRLTAVARELYPDAFGWRRVWGTPRRARS